MTPQGRIVLGAGLAGAGVARNWPGARIYEAAAEPGGYARSHAFAGAWFDCGAHICHSRDEAWLSLVLGHAPLHEMASSRVLNHKSGRWFSYPVQNHLHELPPGDCRLALAGFLEAQRLYRGRTPSNYEEWCRFQYGDYLLENFYRLYTAKYWHLPMDRLSTDWLGGRLLPGQIETILAGARGEQPETQAVFNRFRYPRSGGFFALVSHLFGGLDIAYRKQAVQIDPASRTVHFADGTSADYSDLVSTIPLPDLARMVKDAPASLLDAASRLRALRHYCVNFLVSRETLSDANWFYIYDPDIPAARVSFPASLSGTPSGTTPVQAEILQPAEARPDESALLARTLRDMARILRFSPTEVTDAEIRHHPVSYVVSDLDRAAAAAHVRDWLSARHIHTAGLFGNWSYIWSDRAYASGASLASTLPR